MYLSGKMSQGAPGITLHPVADKLNHHVAAVEQKASSEKCEKFNFFMYWLNLIEHKAQH